RQRLNSYYHIIKYIFLENLAFALGYGGCLRGSSVKNATSRDWDCALLVPSKTFAVTRPTEMIFKTLFHFGIKCDMVYLIAKVFHLIRRYYYDEKKVLINRHGRSRTYSVRRFIALS